MVRAYGSVKICTELYDSNSSKRVERRFVRISTEIVGGKRADWNGEQGSVADSQHSFTVTSA